MIHAYRDGPEPAWASVFVVVPFVGMVQVPVVEVVDVAGMFQRAMPAVRPMDVGVLFVDRMRGFGRHF